MKKFQSRKRFRHCWSARRLPQPARERKFQSRKRFRHCWSFRVSGGMDYTATFQSRKRFRHCWSQYHDSGNQFWIRVSIAKAIPSLLEPNEWYQFPVSLLQFQSRKRFRHCWSMAGELLDDALDGFNRESDSVTVGASFPFSLPVNC